MIVFIAWCCLVLYRRGFSLTAPFIASFAFDYPVDWVWYIVAWVFFPAVTGFLWLQRLLEFDMGFWFVIGGLLLFLWDLLQHAITLMKVFSSD